MKHKNTGLIGILLSTSIMMSVMPQAAFAIEGIGDADSLNVYNIAVSSQYKILSADMFYLDNLDLTYGGSDDFTQLIKSKTLLKSEYNGKIGTYKVLISQNGNKVQTVRNAGTYTVSVYYDDPDYSMYEYDLLPESSAITIGEVTVKKAERLDGTYTVPSGNFTAMSEEKVSDIKPSLPAGWTWEMPNERISGHGMQSFSAVYAGDENYNPVVKSIEVAVSETVPIPTPGTYTYDGEEKNPVSDSAAYTVSGENRATNAGSYVAVMTLKPYYLWFDNTSDPAQMNWDIGKRTPVIDDFDITMPANTGYDGNGKPVQITLMTPYTLAGDITVYYEGVAPTDYAKTTEPPMNIGQYRVTFDVSGGRNFNAASDLYAGEFSIVKSDPQYTIPADLHGTVRDPLSAVALPEGWDWKDGSVIMDTLGDNNFTAVYTPEDTTNYNSPEVELTVTVSKIILTGSPNYYTVRKGGKKLSEAGLTLVDSSITVPGTVKWVDSNGAELPGTTIIELGKEYIWLFIPSDENKYERLTGKAVLYRGSSGGGNSILISVSFDSKGGSAVMSQATAAGGRVTEPNTPTRTGYKFAGWYEDEELTKKFDFMTRISKSMTLYAAWTRKTDSKDQIVLTIGDTEAEVFGKTVYNDVAPIIANSRTMLPARFVAENLGAGVSWDNGKKQVTVRGTNEKGKRVVILITIGQEYAYVNGERVELDSPAFIENDRTYTPIRFISEHLGADVEWDNSARQVIITKK